MRAKVLRQSIFAISGIGIEVFTLNFQTQRIALDRSVDRLRRPLRLEIVAKQIVQIGTNCTSHRRRFGLRSDIADVRAHSVGI